MYIDIVPKKVERIGGENGSTFCIDDCVCAFAGYMGRNFELMFSNSWGIDFISAKEHGSVKIENYLDTIRANKWDLLEKYHGIRLQIEEVSKEEGIDLINAALSSGRPVLLTLDAFWCPWDPAFQKFHNGHALLIVGFDEVSNSYICSDPYFMQYKAYLPIENCRKGFFRIRSFKIQPEPAITHAEEIIRTCAITMLKCDSGENYFDTMRTFGSKLENIDMNKETGGIEQFWNTPLYKAFEIGTTARMEFAVALKYISNKYNIVWFSEMADAFCQIIQKWYVCKGMLIKLSKDKNNTKMLKRLSEKVIQIADEEEKLAWQLAWLDISINNPQISKAAGPDTNVAANLQHSNNIFVDLSKYTNNKGFGTCPFSDCKADFTGYGHYFLMEDKLPDQNWNVQNMKFHVLLNQNGDYDNVSCAGQSITFREDSYAAIQILGCSEYGNYSDSIRLLTDDGNWYSIPVMFYDWGSSVNHDIAAAWEGNIVEITGDELVPQNRIHKIFAKEYTFSLDKKIKGIQLPYCPNMHIFALTLNK